MKKQKRSPQKALSAPLLALVIGGALRITAVAFFAFGGSAGGGTPKLVVDQEKIDYGDVHFNDGKSFTIKITNTGDGVLRFKEQPYIEIVEGC